MLAEAVVIAVQTVILIGLCATIGVSGSDRKAEAESGRPLGLDLYRPEPTDYPATPPRVRLGRQLSCERLLLCDHLLACADCHQPKRRSRHSWLYQGCPPKKINPSQESYYGLVCYLKTYMHYIIIISN